MIFRLSTILIVACTIALAGGALITRGAEAGGGCHANNPVSDGASTTVLMSKNCFGPTIARVDPGAEVTFVNEDQVQHTVTGAALTWGDTENINFGDALEATFTEEGTYPYACILHPGMVGAIVVGDGIGQSAAANVESTGVLVASKSTGGAVPGPAARTASAGQSDDDDTANIALTSGVAAALALAAGAVGGALFMRARRAGSD